MGIKIACQKCESTLDPDWKACPVCLEPIGVEVTGNGKQSVVRVLDQDLARNLPATVPTNPMLPSGLMNLDLSDEADAASATTALLPYISKEAAIWVCERLAAREEDLRMKARKADAASMVAGAIGTSIGASTFTGAAVAIATAPFSLPLIALGVLGVSIFTAGVYLHVDAKNERDEHLNLARNLENSRRKYFHGL